MFAKVVLASKPTNGAPPIITIHARYPRIIHGEIMTHRVFSRNARSSRAVPVATMLKEIRETPFVPWHWGANQKGMQAGAECTARVTIGEKTMWNHAAWLQARDHAVQVAEAFSDAGYHKQIANRLIEPFSFIDTLITSTSWANFLHLRDHEAAEPHFQDLAAMFREAIEGAEYQSLEPGQWHLPYAATQDDVAMVEDYLEPYPETTHPTVDYLKKLSVARCARISYAPFDGDASIEKELERYELLVGSSPLHASPAEHQATPDVFSDEWGEFDEPQLAGNLGSGWIQYRKTLPGEYVADKIAA
ncbi:thymidylate synthase protein [Rhizobium phage RHph_Y2_11]|nr:thymidylate synthase protein [Rhizobium phage RHph_Y2_11]